MSPPSIESTYFFEWRHLHQIILWSWLLDEDRSDAAEHVLADVEKARARRFLDPLHQRRFIAARLRLRTILGMHMGLDPKALAFRENEFGKPYLLQEPRVHFSLSHSENRAILALSRTLEVGADLERIRALEHLDLAQRYFHANEVAAIESMPLEEQLLAFFQIWTLKEAVVKAIGKGLSMPLDEFEVSIATSPPRLIVSPKGAPPKDAWDLQLLAPASGYLCALAIPGAGSGIELIQRTC